MPVHTTSSVDRGRTTTATVGGTIGTYPVAAYSTAAAAIQAAVNAVGNGRLVIRKGTYDIPSSILIPSGIHIEHEDGVVLRASQSFTNGIYNIDAVLSAAENTRIDYVTLDCNNQTSVQAVSIKGGMYAFGAYAKRIRLRAIAFKNQANTSVGLVTIYSGRGSSDRGPVTDVVFDDCLFDTVAKYHILINGGQVEDLKILNSKFRGSQYGCISFDQQTKDDNANAAGARSNKNWEIVGCKFIDNQLSNTPLAGGFTAILTDSNKSGLRGLKFHGNWCEGQNSTDPEQYVLSINSSWDVQVHNNTFWKFRSVFNVGQSNNGPWYRHDGSQMVSIKENTFFRCYNIVDNDSNFFAEWAGNKFIEIEYAGIGGYSRQWPAKIHGNFFYNICTDESASNERRSAIALIANGSEVYDNTIIDDRKLADPTTAPVLTQVAGGALGARTYYVKYTWKNDTGETVGSSEASLSVSANNLLMVEHPYATNYGPPTGAKYVNIYVSTTAGSYTTGLQASVPTPWHQEYQDVRTNTFGHVDWLEPATGLVSGTAIPGSNTTNAITLYGLYEVSGGGGPLYPNTYHDNYIRGTLNSHSWNSAYKRIAHDNYYNPTISATGEQKIERIPYSQGNVSGSVTFDVGNGEVNTSTFTGNITATTLASGHYLGQVWERRFTMGGAGSYTYTKASNEKLAGGSFTPTAAVGSLDTLVQEWDGTYWVEKRRSMAVS